MAPASSLLRPRQSFGSDRNGNNNGPFGSNGSGSFSKWAIIGVVAAVAFIAFIVSAVVFRRIRRRRRDVVPMMNLTSATPYRPNTTLPVPPQNNVSEPSKYAGVPGGYTATADQNHSLLSNAEAPAIVMWDPDHASSTQDGFGYDNNLHLAGAAIQRPASIASFSAPPPRYEEATSSAPGSSAGRRPQGAGEAASYFNTGLRIGDEERGRSRSVDPSAASPGGRARALSADNRSVNGDRRRSMSRFREEGMVDVNVGSKS